MVMVTGKKLILRSSLNKQSQDTRDGVGGRVVQIRIKTDNISFLKHPGLCSERNHLFLGLGIMVAKASHWGCILLCT